MIGRYGNDQLNFALILASLFCALFTFFTYGIADLVFSLLQIMLLAVWAMRSFSRNIHKRRSENIAFMKFWNKTKTRFSGVTAFFKRVADREHRYFKCPKCASRLRVPRGRGNITVTCPRCSHKFDKKS
ncbi:MAG: hypothetical protein IJC20_01995 [Clostridia bacterium]|nr:hypothetical protein [Clostridia bacterium]